MFGNSVFEILISVVGGINCVVFSTYFISKYRKKLKSTMFLSTFLLTSGIYLLLKSFFILLNKDNQSLVSSFLFVLWLIYFSVKGPCFYLFFKYIRNENKKMSFRNLYHFLPLVTIILFSPNNNSFTNLYTYFIYSITILYIIMVFFLLLRNRKDFISINHYRFTLTTLLAFSIQQFLIMVFWFCNLPSIESISILVLSYLIIMVELKNKYFTTSFKQPEKYKNILLTEKEVSDHFNKIIMFLESSKLYKKNSITVKDLSSKLSIQPYLLSLVINQCYGTNFNDFINSFRLKEAKKMLLDENYSNLTIESIAFECGFSTLSIFNTYFKKKSSLTPSQFRRNNKEIYSLVS